MVGSIPSLTRSGRPPASCSAASPRAARRPRCGSGPPGHSAEPPGGFAAHQPVHGDCEIPHWANARLPPRLGGVPTAARGVRDQRGASLHITCAGTQTSCAESSRHRHQMASPGRTEPRPQGQYRATEGTQRDDPERDPAEDRLRGYTKTTADLEFEIAEDPEFRPERRLPPKESPPGRSAYGNGVSAGHQPSPPRTRPAQAASTASGRRPTRRPATPRPATATETASRRTGTSFRPRRHRRPCRRGAASRG